MKNKNILIFSYERGQSSLEANVRIYIDICAQKAKYLEEPRLLIGSPAMQKAAESLPLTAYGIAFPTRTAKEKVPEIKAKVIVYAEASASLRKDEFFPTRRRRFVCAET